jgi:hypothetical protein
MEVDQQQSTREGRNPGVRRIAVLGLRNLSRHEQVLTFLGIFCISFIHGLCDLLRNNYLVIGTESVVIVAD